MLIYVLLLVLLYHYQDQDCDLISDAWSVTENLSIDARSQLHFADSRKVTPKCLDDVDIVSGMSPLVTPLFSDYSGLTLRTTRILYSTFQSVVEHLRLPQSWKPHIDINSYLTQLRSCSFPPHLGSPNMLTSAHTMLMKHGLGQPFCPLHEFGQPFNMLPRDLVTSSTQWADLRCHTITVSLYEKLQISELRI